MDRPGDHASGDHDRHDPDELAVEATEELASLLFSQLDQDATLNAVAMLASRSLPGCDAVSVTVLEDGKPRTRASTQPVAERIDDRQYSTGEGPCLDAMRKGAAVMVDSYADEDLPWPQVLPDIRANGVSSSLSLPLVVGEDVVGALNIYGRTERCFQGAEAAAEAFAAQAAVTLANATAFHRTARLAEHLAVALENRDVIGQAKGILMASTGCSADRAFELLRQQSQHENRKLVDVARAIVASTARRGDGG
ncbi:MAG: GAF and ANTAR domain-containing protein [Acidimicrobiia bacterium]